MTPPITLLESIRDALAALPGVQTCKIGLEPNITPADYPIIRVVPSRMLPGDTTVSGEMLTRNTELLIYFGAPVQQFDEAPDDGGRTRLEKVYAALFDMEALILNALADRPAGVLWARYIETITDEDRLDTYKLMAVRCEVKG